MVLSVRLLGELSVRAGERPVPLPAHPQGAPLLAWLALHPGKNDRGPLAALLWPDMRPSSARAELRSAVWALRRALASASARSASGLSAGRPRVSAGPSGSGVGLVML
ncbi:MAG: hypothetical protein KY463_07005, partial [Actinobacteria bacterium]|nr:hypothetical protein [Actinomycetota bacterium]